MSTEPQSLGELLRAARGSAGLSIEVLAERICQALYPQADVREWQHGNWIANLEGVEHGDGLTSNELETIASAIGLRPVPDEWYDAAGEYPPDIREIALNRANWPWMRNLSALVGLADAVRACRVAYAAVAAHEARQPQHFTDPSGFGAVEFARAVNAQQAEFDAWSNALDALTDDAERTDEGVRVAADALRAPSVAACARCEYDACGGVHNATCPHGAETRADALAAARNDPGEGE